ncbi:MAG: hypothetical protein HOP10_13000 [Chitinophagaceae bacterium]|nr:hypothetical protein [Chitinophagaceae bacterium]
MSSHLKLKSIFTAILALLIIACNNDKPEKIKVQEVNLQDIQQEDTTIGPPPPPKSEPPTLEIAQAETKCFTGDGLKYKTTIRISFGEKMVVGNMTSEDMTSGEKQAGKFTGTMKGDQLDVLFAKDRPIVGDASEWTDKPWTIKKIGGKEVLQIVFKAKNYDNNKWEDTAYEFELTACGK